MTETWEERARAAHSQKRIILLNYAEKGLFMCPGYVCDFWKKGPCSGKNGPEPYFCYRPLKLTWQYQCF